MHSSGKQLAEITRLVEAGVIKPVIDKVFSFSEAQQAMDYLEKGRSRGKVIVKIRD